MRTVISLVGLVLLLTWPMGAQDVPPGPPAPGGPETAPAEAPLPHPGLPGPEGPMHFRTSQMHAMGFGAWWKNSEIVSKLQLSEDQVKRIEKAFLDHRLKLVDLRADLEKQELQLGPLLDADRPDQQRVATQIDQITLARGRLEKENAMMMLDIRSVLTVEQWKKLQSLREPHRRMPEGERKGFRPGEGFRPPS
jgi:Spy/CpxP family protein refolding chaperone